MAETAAQRYDRDFHQALLVNADRFNRTLKAQPQERWGRVYVDSATGNSAADPDIP